ncbi:MAG: bile acid:sodium symporter, partial [Deltaproteobacteria bacterium]|nr:bile acid:sodium symporter [Deltaproteobacteria bacterium]
MAEFYLQYEYHITSAQLIFAMLGMGVTLRPAAFMEILRFPKGFALGLGSVLIISPALALAIATLFDFEPGVATGLILVAAVPGGTMSNILTYFAKANVPLSIALTAVATTGCLLTTPIVLQVFAGGAVEAQIEMPGGRIAAEIALFLLLPLALGMLIGARLNGQREAVARVFIRVSLAMIALIIVGSGAADRIDPGAHGPAVLGGIILFSFLLFFAGFGLLKLTGFPAR